MDYNNEIYQQFIKFGAVADEKERVKIIELIIEWRETSREKARVNYKYVEVINEFVTNKTIIQMLKEQPSLKQDFIEKLLHLLESLDESLNTFKHDDNETDLLNNFSKEKLSDKNFGEEVYNKSKLLTKIEKDSFKNKLDTHLVESNKEKQNKLSVLKNELDLKWRKLIDQKNSKTKLANQLQKLNTNNEEEKLINQFSKLKIKDFEKLWAGWNRFKKHLKKSYQKKDIDLNSYQEVFKQIQNETEAKNTTNFENEKKDFSENWQIKIREELLLKRKSLISKIKDSFYEDLINKIKKIQDALKVLAPFYDAVFPSNYLWDLAEGKWQNYDFKMLETYAQKLKDNEDIVELAKILGRYNKAEVKLEEESFESIEQYYKFKINHSGKSDLVGVEESNNLNNLLASEIAILGTEETETVFFKKYAENKLLSYKYISKQKQFENRKVKLSRSKKTEKNKGPFIIAIDTSGSMRGTPEKLAKIIAFAITKMAIKEKRKAYLISFSTRINTFELTDFQNNIPKLINFLQMSFNGGTDVTNAVSETINTMSKKDYKKADLLIVSDGDFGSLNKSKLDKIEQLKLKGNRFNSLIIGNRQNNSALSFCNNVWETNGEVDSLKILIKNMRKEFI